MGTQILWNSNTTRTSLPPAGWKDSLGSSVWATGSFDSWSGWGVELQDVSGDGVYIGDFTSLDAGTIVEFVVLPTSQAWDDKIAPSLGTACDFDPADEFNNFGFSAGAAPTVVQIPSDCGGGSGGSAPTPSAPAKTDVTLYFDLNSMMPSSPPTSLWATGTADSWSGWGVELKDENRDGTYVGVFEQATVGDDFEFVILPWGQGWDNKFAPTLGSSCDVPNTDENANYGFNAQENTPVHIRVDCSTHVNDWRLIWSDEFTTWDALHWTSAGFGEAPWRPDNNAWGGGNSEVRVKDDKLRLLLLRTSDTNKTPRPLVNRRHDSHTI